MARRVGIETRGGRLVHLTNMVAIGVVVSFACVLRDVFSLIVMALKIGQDFFGRVAQIYAQMVNQLQFALFVDLCEQRHFRVGRAALHQCAAGVVAHAAQDGRADTGRADDRMRFAPQRFQQQFELVQGRTRQANDLFVVVDGLDDIHPHGVHNHDVAIVIVAVGGRAARQTCIRRLRNHNHVCFDASL